MDDRQRIHAVLAGHVDVEQQHHIGAARQHVAQFAVVGGLRHDFDVSRFREDLVQAAAHDGVVVAQDDADHAWPPRDTGSDSMTVVPWLGEP